MVPSTASGERTSPVVLESGSSAEIEATTGPAGTVLTSPTVADTRITTPPEVATGLTTGAADGATSQDTRSWLPTQIIVENTSANNPSASDVTIAKATNSPGSASGLPRAITPAVTTVPSGNYEIVYVGFNSELNYPFVVQHSISSAQIFQYLPEVLTFPFSDQQNYKDVSVRRLIPFTAEGITYTITVAEVYFPSDSVAALANFILTPDSKLYRNPDATERSLSSLIDARIPLTGLDTSDSGSDGQAATTGSTQNYGSIDSSTEIPEVQDKGRIVGITIGAAAGCGLYMSFMVLLFKSCLLYTSRCV